MWNLFDCNNYYLFSTYECLLHEFLSTVEFYAFFRLYFLKHFTFVFKCWGFLLLLIHFVYALHVANNIFILLLVVAFFFLLFNRFTHFIVKIKVCW